ncbi:MAG: DNA polymerase Y family protein [Rhodoferax sp.]|jgi:protein ImuB|uniref:Y-family DNA polymerase n=1 Tax=Rhodoferax sp. TaxID=50421 RepID=UPI001B745A7B|nr:DNA polymerase Y family protein [Rhodoferax sp.]MBP8286211.1 DNA polymerase Y family protein [Rhodoferax sp.]MBP9734737.1 DNA polymerase Y family protein [Rhodoferax sp.]
MYWVALQPFSDADLPAAGTLADPVLALAWWALQFTPRVARLQDVVLLEVSSSERLWGGRAALLRRIYTSDKPVAHIRYARGATSLVAFARLLTGVKAGFPPAKLPLAALPAAQDHLATLARLGCTTWGEVCALPRDGLARRFGASLVDALDQALGSRPDVYPWLVLPEVFEAKLELQSHTDNANALLFGARRLLAQMQCWLQLRQLGVLAIELGWVLDARRGTDTAGSLQIRTASPAQSTEHLQRLLAERLAQVALPAPVQALKLRSLQTQTFVAGSASLLPDEQHAGDPLAQTLERLSARLGADQVLRLQACADHRPEQRQAWVVASFAAKAPPAPKGWASELWPTWLLPQPQPLQVQHQVPQLDGPLTMLSGPQRLEAGWWPDPSLPSPPAATLRDYFLARSARSPLVWIYRERLVGADSHGSAMWFLQGIFA